MDEPIDLANLVKEKFGTKYNIRIMKGQKYVWIAISKKEESDGTNTVREESAGPEIPKETGE